MTITSLFAPPRPPPQNLHFLQTFPPSTLLFPYLWITVNHVFYGSSTLINLFSLFQVCFQFQSNVVWAVGRYVRNWKVNEACNWPCWPGLGSAFWDISVPRWKGLGCDWRTRASQNLLYPQISTFPWLSPMESPPPRLFVISPKSTAPLATVPLTMHSTSGCIFWATAAVIPNAIARALHIFFPLNGSAERFSWKQDTLHALLHRMR